MTNGTPRATSSAPMPLQTPTLSWVLKRTALAVLILFVVVGGAAWLLDASIDRSASASNDPAVLGNSQNVSDAGLKY